MLKCFGTSVLMEDTEISKQLLQIKQKLVQNPYWPKADHAVGYLQSVVKLKLAQLNTNPFSGREQKTNPEPPDYKSSALTPRPRRPESYISSFLHDRSHQRRDKCLWQDFKKVNSCTKKLN